MNLHTYEYPRPALTVDCVVFGWNGADLQVLLIQRNESPFEGHWALPGGFVHQDEALEAAARRELEEETGLKDMYLEQLYTFGTPGRDPRGHVVTVAWYALIDIHRFQQPVGGTDASDAAWFPLSALPGLAFDHDVILDFAFRRLQGKIQYRPVGFELLPEKFSFSQLQQLYETILKEKFDRRNFRKKILSMEILSECGETAKDVPHRAAKLYRFDESRYRELEKSGFVFEI